MATTAAGTPYVESSDLVANYPGVSLSLANHIDGLDGGKILQVVNVVKTGSFSTTSTSFIDLTGLTATITPASTSSKILVQINIGVLGISASNQVCLLRLLRDSTNIVSNTSGGLADTQDAYGSGPGAANTNTAGNSISFLDSPSSTSALVYKLTIRTTGGTGYVNQWGLNTDAGGVSTITLMEVGA